MAKNIKFDIEARKSLKDGVDALANAVKVTLALAARELALKEGLFLGYSCGSAIQGLRHVKLNGISLDYSVIF